MNNKKERPGLPKRSEFMPGNCAGLKLPGAAPALNLARRQKSLEFDLCTSCFQLGFDLFGFVLGRAFFDSLAASFDQFLGFLEAQRRDRTDFLDHVDLLVASVDQDDVELILFFSRFTAGVAASSAAQFIIF